jgi:precorrin-6A/cobalt-precorrin-6A reductase
LPAPDKPVLILGGTAEAAELAAVLVASGHTVTTSLAGRTREPMPIAGQVRVGGFGGAQGLADYLQDHHVALLIDMTHPFASNISKNARDASSITGVHLIAWQRPLWPKVEGDQWQKIGSITEAVSAIPPRARVLLALGSQHIAPFASRSDIHFLVRMIDPPLAPLALPDHELHFGKPGSVEEEFALLQSHAITHIVCRNSGGKASYTKIAAARLLSLPVIIIDQNSNSAGSATLTQVLEEISAYLG